MNLQERVLDVYREPSGEDYTAQLRYTLEEKASPLLDRSRVMQESVFILELYLHSISVHLK